MRICNNCGHDTLDPNVWNCPKCGVKLRKPMMIYFAHYKRTASNIDDYRYCARLLKYLFDKQVPVYYAFRGKRILFYRQISDSDMEISGLFHICASDRKPLAERWSNRVKPFDTLRNRMMGIKR